jgi:hypothetical protein
MKTTMKLEKIITNKHMGDEKQGRKNESYKSEEDNNKSYKPKTYYDKNDNEEDNNKSH